MRLDNYSVAPFEALEPIEAFEPVHRDADAPRQGAPGTPAPEPVAVEEAPSQLLSEMAQQPPAFVLLPEPGPRRRLPRLDDGDRWALRQREPEGRFERFEHSEPFERESAGDGELPGRTPPAGVNEVPAPAASPASAPAPAPAPTPVEAAAPAAAPAAEPVAPPPAPTATAATVALPLGPAVSPDWLNQREAALKGVRAEFEAAREAARRAPPADVANAAGSGWVPAPTDHDGNPVNGAVFVPDAAAAAAAPEFVPAWMLREGVGAPAPQGQWLSFDDGAYEQAYRERLAARPEASVPLTQLAALYGQPVQQLLGAQPGLWTLATQDHAINAGAPPQPGVAMGDAAGLGQLDLYLADPFITQLREQLGGTPAAPASGLALEQQRLYGTERAAELTQLSQAMSAVRQAHAAAMQAARDGGGAGWVEVPMQFGTDPETGWPTGVYETVSHGDSAEIARDANGAPVLAKQRVFDEAVFTNAWLAEGASSGGLAQEAFARFYGQAHSHIALQQDNSESGGPPRWVSQPSLDNPHVGLGDSGVLDGDLVALDLNHAPRLNNDAAVGFDPQLGWVTSRDNIHEHRSWFDKAMPIVMVAFVSWATAGAASAAGWGAIGSAAAAGAAASFAGGVINGNLSLKGVLIGAVSGALTAGLTPGLTNTLKDAGLGAAAGVAARMTVQGGIQALLGGKFKDGALAGFASGLADLTKVNIGENIDKAVQAGTMSAADALAARTFNTVLSSAIRAAGSPGDPAHAFASDFLGELLQQSGVPATPDEPVTQTAFDDEGNLMPGIVDPNATPAERQAQLAAHLQAQGLEPAQAQQLATETVLRQELQRAVLTDPRVQGGRLVPDPAHDAALEGVNAEFGINPDGDPALMPVGWLDDASKGLASYVRRISERAGGKLKSTLDDVMEAVTIKRLDQAQQSIARYLDDVAARGGLSEAEIVVLGTLYAANAALFPTTVLDVVPGAGKAIGKVGDLIRAGANAREVAVATRIESRGLAEWERAAQLQAARAEAQFTAQGITVVREVPGQKGAWNDALNGGLKPNTGYVLANGHSYVTDAAGRVTRAEGDLSALIRSDRNLYQQVRAGEIGGQGYEGGHLIGSLFGGAGEKINLVPQLTSVNRGEYRAMERTWAEAIRDGKQVKVEVSPVYAGGSQVPTKIEVIYWIDGQRAVQTFRN
ncbi:DNA/RNA non-specific endonuclease [Pelomonas sp. Root1444]|uniref:DNA/RNA non-specific endonuclease n=1 Tax=Pelomonas sp. Root1444 TaxID=1736464 RepID=UPI00070258C3|nr:DNA/RNA non-specific endonuclease [Pelomonas sp. Root1444]KQY89264.1 hypothetical protein ASD35_17390 [Pelomonas sp. Root1444]